MTAGDALLGAAVAALRTVEGIGGVYDSPPLQAALPHALAAIDLESDWGHKSGAGRELRLTVSIFDAGERPVRLRALAGAAEAALAGVEGTLGEWQLVSLAFVRRRFVRARDGAWTAAIEHRARMLRG